MAVITNTMYNGAFAQIQTFKEYLITYTYQTEYSTQMQADNLYLDLGIILLISGIILFVIIISPKKTAT